MRVLFVCLGNICRSPTAEAVFSHQLDMAGLAMRVTVDSAGTGHWHVGKSPDERACQAGARRGYRLSHLLARQFDVADFERFDLILAMDRANLAHLEALRPSCSRAELALYLEYVGLVPSEVPDPYYGEAAGFDHVIDLLEAAGERLLDDLRTRL